MIYNKISCLGVGIVKDGNVSDRSDSGGMKNNAQVGKGVGDVKNGSLPGPDRGVAKVKTSAAVAAYATPSPPLTTTDSNHL